jgi:hypothetical protein
MALLLGNDPRRFHTVDGTDIHALCRPSATVCLTYEDGSVCYGFLDSSRIVVTAERWEAREANQPGKIRLGAIANMEILPGGEFMGRKAQSWTSADTLESGLPRSFGITVSF